MKNKKLINVFIIITIFIAVLIFIIISTKLDTTFLRKPSQVYESVYVIDGNNGNSVKLLDKEKEELLEKLKGLELTKDFFYKPSTEWLYHIQFTVENELYMITIINDNYIAINENKFYKTKTTQLIDFIKEIL